MPVRRLSRARNSRPGVYRRPTGVQWTARRRRVRGRTGTASVGFTFSLGLSVGAPTETFEWAKIGFTFGVGLRLAARNRGTDRRLVVCDVNGSPFGELDAAEFGDLQFDHNQPESWSFSLPVDDPKVSLLLDERFREIQYWRGDQLLAWGPMVRPQVGLGRDDRVQVACRGAAWHLTRRYVGKADRTNYVTNGSFELGPAGWSIGYSSPLEPAANQTYTNFTWSIVSDATIQPVTGTRSLYMRQTDPNTPLYGVSAAQFFEWTPPADSHDGDTFTLVGYCYIPSSQWVGPKSGNGGLRLARFSTTETVDIGGVAYPKPLQGAQQSITDDTPQDTWVRMAVELTVPTPGVTELVTVGIDCPNGGIYWDQVALYRNEALRWFAADQTSVIAKGLVEHSQDPTYDKNDVNIGTDCQPSGVVRDREYVFSEHPNIADAINDLTKLDNGFDWSMAYTPTERRFTTHFPSRGVRRPECSLELGRNVSSFDWTFDGETAATSVISLGQGSSPGREEGVAVDTSGFSGGLILEDVFSAPPETPIDSLDNLAAERLAVARTPEVLVANIHPSSTDLIGVVGVGDVLPVVIHRGGFDVSADYRVVRKTLTREGLLRLDLNLRADL